MVKYCQKYFLLWRNLLKYNPNFKLNPKDIALIEEALRHLSFSRKEKKFNDDIHALIAKIHHQKIPYRPKDGIYVSG